MLTIQDKKGNRVVEVFDNQYDNSVRHIASHLRDPDFDEIFDATGESPHITIFKGWDMAMKRWIIFDSNNCAVAVLGVRPVEVFSKNGVVWLLGTDGLDKISKFFLKISKPIIEDMKQGFDMIFGFVDSRYEKSKRWLEWCGFIVTEPPIPFGINKLPFHQFYMRNE